MATYRIEWIDGRIDLANSVYSARALVLARYPGTLFAPEARPSDDSGTICFQRQFNGDEGDEQRRPIAVIRLVP